MHYQVIRKMVRRVHDPLDVRFDALGLELYFTAGLLFTVSQKKTVLIVSARVPV